MFKKILIANRGEIAVRIIRACKELGICSVAVYSDVDRYALHVKRADQAQPLGPESVAAYLNVPRIINVAKATNCDAIHPGYGFLSENPELAAACAKHGIEFIGPSAKAITSLGNKISARSSMQAAGIPVVPGSEGNIDSLEQALAVANDIGYPVMLKATSGGGGRGIRRCDSAKHLEQYYQRVISEAEKAFGDTHIYLEKFIDEPKHIEVQVLADKHGNAIHLFERDCSIQRRHQKLIEVAPSPQIDETLRQQLADWALKAVAAENYVNAGTVEFLVDKHQQAYFLEMNTRLQVEHPITEAITGIDIVKQQIKIAAGLPMDYQQSDVQRRGVAMEFRINAEDPKNDFLPSFGKITQYYAPGAIGVRTDSAIYAGYTIPPDYDSLCAKLIVWALTWDECIARSKRALSEMRMYGVKTTMPYYLAILNHPEFQQGRFTTTFVEDNPQLIEYSQKAHPGHRAAAIAAAIAAHQEGCDES